MLTSRLESILTAFKRFHHNVDESGQRRCQKGSSRINRHNHRGNHSSDSSNNPSRCPGVGINEIVNTHTTELVKRILKRFDTARIETGKARDKIAKTANARDYRRDAADIDFGNFICKLSKTLSEINEHVAEFVKPCFIRKNAIVRERRL